MLCFRITHKDFSRGLIAPGLPGRWNGSGKKVIYCAESVALALLENMVRRQGVGFNNDFRIMVIDIPDSLKVTTIREESLVSGWRDFRHYGLCQPLGNTWYELGKTPLLKVPSAVLPQSFNYVINAEHPDFKKIKLVNVVPLIPDERIEAILRKKS